MGKNRLSRPTENQKYDEYRIAAESIRKKEKKKGDSMHYRLFSFPITHKGWTFHVTLWQPCLVLD